MILLAALVIIILAAVLYWLFMSPYSQVFGKFPWRAITKDKMVALTFDDGPNEPFTTQIADFLAKQKILATFFEVGECIQRYPEVTKRLYKEGHVIGNHSVHHKFTNYFREPGFETEITSNQKIIEKVIGKKPALFRPPWLLRQPVLLETLRKLNLQPVSGEFCDNLEIFQLGSEQIAKHTINKIKPGAIIIFHDGYDAKGGNRQETVKAVELVVAELIKRKYKFVTVDELLNVKPYLE